MSTIPTLQGVIRDTGTISITSTTTVLTLQGVETFAMIELGANAEIVDIRVSVRYEAGGQDYPAQVLPLAPLEGIPSAHGRFFTNGWEQAPPYNTVPMNANVNTYTNRIFFVPCVGVEELLLRTPSVTPIDARVKQCVGPPPYVQALTKEQRSMAWYQDSVAITNTAYTDGLVIGGSFSVPFYMNDPLMTRYIAPRLRAFTFADYGLGLGDFDIIAATPGANTPIANSTLLDLDFAEEVVGWWECRQTPTGDQIPIRDGGASAGNIAILNGLDVQLVNNQNAGDGNLIDIFLVNREVSVTPTAGNTWYSIVMEI